MHMVPAAPHLGNPPPGPIIDGQKYVDASIIVGTVDVNAAELRDLATGDPVVIRSVTVASHTYYCWSDAFLAAAVMRRLSPVEADPPW